MKSICLIIAVLGFCAVGHAATISESVGLVPGSFNLNFGKLQSVQNGDKIVITFYAKSGYELVKSGVSDISDLGWKQKGNTFSVAVGANKPLAKGSINKPYFWASCAVLLVAAIMVTSCLIGTLRLPLRFLMIMRVPVEISFAILLVP